MGGRVPGDQSDTGNLFRRHLDRIGGQQVMGYYDHRLCDLRKVLRQGKPAKRAGL
jgi:hypothetical protein